MGAAADLLDHALDLVVGSACVGCRRPGRLLCPGCRATLPVVARAARPDPAPPGLAPAWAVGEHEGLLRRLVIDHKEESRFGLGPPLGRLLALAVTAALDHAAHDRPPDDPDDGGDALLVPVPSRPGVARARGDDPTGRLVRVAARTAARETGRRVLVVPLLRSHRGVLDQAGLDTAARARNLAGSMWVPDRALRRAARRTPGGPVVLCDDVLTTGATVREAQRALAAVGVEVAGVAVVGTVRRRRPPGV